MSLTLQKHDYSNNYILIDILKIKLKIFPGDQCILCGLQK